MSRFTDLVHLARAAMLMRKRAEAANTDDARRPYSDKRLAPVPEHEWPELVENYLGGVMGEHCASWTPAVAMAVAAWLETGVNPYSCVDRTPMVTLARVYLGLPALEASGPPGGAV